MGRICCPKGHVTVLSGNAEEHVELKSGDDIGENARLWPMIQCWECGALWVATYSWPDAEDFDEDAQRSAPGFDGVEGVWFMPDLPEGKFPPHFVNGRNPFVYLDPRHANWTFEEDER